uniref:von Willebrand factor D and EGF domains n=1 Tax=Sarcophilus harrisii TaxID=9305 RepID=G3WMS0_SARHA
MSLTVQSPGSDYGSTRGLCGTFDGDPENDFHDQRGSPLKERPDPYLAFISEWRLSPGRSMFDELPRPLKSPGKISYCSCAGAEAGSPWVSAPGSPSPSGAASGCRDAERVRRPSLIPELDVAMDADGPSRSFRRRSLKEEKHPGPFFPSQEKYAHLTRGESEGAIGQRNGRGKPAPLEAGDPPPRERPSARSRQKREHLRGHLPAFSVPDLGPADLEGLSYFFPEDHAADAQPEPAPSWPTPSGLTEARVGEVCRQRLANSSIGRACAGFLGERLDSALAMCVKDVLLKDNLGWADAGLALLENECERRVLQEGAHSPEGDGRAPEDVLLALRCPGLCSGRGQCMEWGCACSQGFSSFDCSVWSDQAPEITELENAGLCDIQLSGCTAVRVFGHGFRESRTPKCEVTPQQYNGSQGIPGAPVYTDVVFQNSTTVTCRLPAHVQKLPTMDQWGDGPIVKWQVKVSNDGLRFSNPQILTLYDGACQTCDPRGRCTLKEKLCLVDGRCYRDGAPSPTGPCRLCRSDLSRWTWSVSPVGTGDKAPTLWTFYGANFTQQLRATDPEGSPVSYTLRAGPRAAGVSPGGVLLWKALSWGAHTFTVGAADDCRAEATVTVEVSVKPCDCLNGGRCVPRGGGPRGRGPGFEGPACEAAGCEPRPCGPGPCGEAPGQHASRDPAYRRETGSQQERSEPGSRRPSPPAPPSQTFWATSPPFCSSAICRHPCGRGMECVRPNVCRCKAGFSGPSCHTALCCPGCKNHGKCIKPGVCGPWGNHLPPCRHGGSCLAHNFCSCPYGFVGPRCETAVCTKHCEHGGQCLAPDVCQCQRGWFGPTCATALCEPVCLNGGVCHKPNSCLCPTGFFGSRCQNAICSPPCKNGGQCVRNNVCSCPEGFTGRPGQCPRHLV